MINPIFSRLNRWRAWSDRRMLDAARELTASQLNQEFAIGQGTYFKTLQHLQAAEAVWINRLTGRPLTKISDLPVHADLASLEAAWNESDGLWEGYIALVDEPELARIIPITNSRGITGQMPVMDILLHVSTHAAYTQAQGSNMLRQLGAIPVDQMLATLSRAEHPLPS